MATTEEVELAGELRELIGWANTSRVLAQKRLCELVRHRNPALAAEGVQDREISKAIRTAIYEATMAIQEPHRIYAVERPATLLRESAQRLLRVHRDSTSKDRAQDTRLQAIKLLNLRVSERTWRSDAGPEDELMALVASQLLADQGPHAYRVLSQNSVFYVEHRHFVSAEHVLNLKAIQSLPAITYLTEKTQIESVIGATITNVEDGFISTLTFPHELAPGEEVALAIKLRGSEPVSDPPFLTTNPSVPTDRAALAVHFDTEPALAWWFESVAWEAEINRKPAPRQILNSTDGWFKHTFVNQRERAHFGIAWRW